MGRRQKFALPLADGLGGTTCEEALQPLRRSDLMVYEASQEGIPNVHPVCLEGSKGQFCCSPMAVSDRSGDQLTAHDPISLNAKAENSSKTSEKFGGGARKV